MISFGYISGYQARAADNLWLTNDDRMFFRAVLPVMIENEQLLDNMILTDYINHIDSYLKTLPAVSQEEFRDLLNILSSPGKVVLTGIWGRWDNANAKNIEQFLERWRSSSLALLRKAYSSILNLSAMKWYDMERSWPNIGYPKHPYGEQLITPHNNF